MEMNEYSYEEIVAMFSDPISILQAGFPVIFGIVIGLIILAFYGYRLWSYEVKIIVAIVLGVVGYTLSSTYIPLESMPAGINLPAIIGFVCAILGAVIAKFLFKLSIFASGLSILFTATIISTPAAFAWLIASTVWGITPSSAATTRIAISVAFAPRIRIAVNASCPGVSKNVI